MLSNEDMAKLIALMDSAGYQVLDIGREDQTQTPYYQTRHTIIFMRQVPKPREG